MSVIYHVPILGYKSSIAPCCLLTESKLLSSNALGEADVLQGPHRGHRRGRKKRRIPPFPDRAENMAAKYFPWIFILLFEFSPQRLQKAEESDKLQIGEAQARVGGVKGSF